MFATANVEKVIRHLVRFGATHAEAEDLAQESLLIAWRKNAELDRERSLDGWLFGIARNVYRNHARSMKRSPITDAAAAESTRTGSSPSIASSITVRAALQTLPENQQDIVILHELEEYTLKETAELLEIPFDTAKDRLRRAREALRTTMRDDFAAAGESERAEARARSRAAVAGVLAGFVGLLANSGSAAAAAGGATAASQGAGTAEGVGQGAGVANGVASGWLAKLAVGAALVAGGIGIGVVAQRARDDAPTAARAPSAASETSVVVAVAGPPGTTPAAVAPVAVTPAAVTPAAVTPVAATPDAGVAATAPRVARTPVPPSVPVLAEPGGPGANAEAQVIERARTALTRGRHDEALRTLMSHERKFPAGQLAEERDVLAIEAYVSTRNVRIARDRIARFTAEYPTSIHRGKIAALAQELDP